MGGYDRLRLVGIPLSAFFCFKEVRKIHFAKMCKTKIGQTEFPTLGCWGVADLESCVLVMGRFVFKRFVGGGGFGDFLVCNFGVVQ